MDNERKSDLPKKGGAIISVSVETVNNDGISIQNTTPMDNCPLIEQETDLNNLHNEENFDVSQSGDYEIQFMTFPTLKYEINKKIFLNCFR